MPNRQQTKAGSLEEFLLAPPNLCLARHVRQGGNVTPVPQPRLVRWSDDVASEIHARVVSWLTSGDIGTLGGLLKEHPTAITHPAVFYQILHLASLTRRNIEDEAGEPLESTPLPPGTGQAARAALLDLLRAWVGRLLPAYTIEPMRVPRRRGAPQQMDYGEALDLLFDFQELLRKLSRRNAMDFRLRAGETRESLIERTARMLQEIYGESWFALTIVAPPDRPDADSLEWIINIRSLPETVAQDIAGQAVRNRSVSKNKLLYGLLAHCLYDPPRTPDQVRGIIERAEADSHSPTRRRPARRR